MRYSQNPQESQTRTPAKKNHGVPRTLGVLGVHPTQLSLEYIQSLWKPYDGTQRCRWWWFDGDDFHPIGSIPIRKAANHLKQKNVKMWKLGEFWEYFGFKDETKESYGGFLKWWYPQNTPKWSFLVGKPMVVGYHHFRKPPYSKRFIEIWESILGCIVYTHTHTRTHRFFSSQALSGPMHARPLEGFW